MVLYYSSYERIILESYYLYESALRIVQNHQNIYSEEGGILSKVLSDYMQRLQSEYENIEEFSFDEEDFYYDVMEEQFRLDGEPNKEKIAEHIWVLLGKNNNLFTPISVNVWEDSDFDPWISISDEEYYRELIS